MPTNTPSGWEWGYKNHQAGTTRHRPRFTFLFDEPLSVSHSLSSLRLTRSLPNPDPNTVAAVVHDERVLGQEVGLLQGPVLHLLDPQRTVLQIRNRI